MVRMILGDSESQNDAMCNALTVNGLKSRSVDLDLDGVVSL